MAANSSATTGIARFGKRFVSQICARTAPPGSLSSPLAAFRRNVHESVYDKNLEEQVRPTFAPDNVDGEQQQDKFWGPNPQTGVFGPGSEANKGQYSPANGGGESVLEEKVFFRPTEGLEKPQHN